MYKVTVIIPVYNAEKYLKKCLDSVVNQTLKDIEIICIDDCSNDKSIDILKEYKEKDSRLIIVQNSHNLGQGKTRNIGISMAKGEYISFIDNDDWYDEDFLEKLYNSAIANNSDVVCCTSRRIYKQQDNSTLEQHCNYKDIYALKHDMMNNFVQAWLKIYKRDFIEKNNIKFSSNMGEDLPFAIYVFLATNKISAVSDTYYNYFERSDSTCRQAASDKNLIEVLQFKKIYKKFKKYKFAEYEYKQYKQSIDARLLRTYKFILSKCITPKMKFKLKLCMYTSFFPLMFTEEIQPSIKPMLINKFSEIFSVRNGNTRKVITILGIKIKFKNNKLIERKRIEKMENKLKKIKEKFTQQNEKIKKQKKEFQKQQEKIIAQEEKINQQNNQIFDLKEKINQINQEILKIKQETLKINQTPSITELAMIKTKYHWDNIKIPVIKNNFETIEELKNSTKSLIRFGDGDFSLMEGLDIPYQKHNIQLANKLKEIIYNNDKNLLTGIPEPYYDYPINLCDVSKKFVLDWFPKWHKIIEKYINYDKTYYSTHISQSFPIYKEYDFEKHYFELKQIWDKKKIVIITGDRVYNNIEYNIFDNATSIDYIYGPTENAFDEFENLKNKISEFSKENILIFALGPAGKVLAYEMYRTGYRVLDLGHLIKDYDFYKKSPNITSKEWENKRLVFFKKD